MKRFRIRPAAWLAGFAFWTALCLAQPSQAELFVADTFTLENGLQVVVLPKHLAPVVYQILVYKAGAADGAPGKNGVAHFLEHLMFKGTKRFGDGVFTREVDRHGGNDNAFTNQDVTAYHQQIAKRDLPLIMEMEADRMNGLVLSDPIVLPERDVIIEERHQRIENNPGAQLSEMMDAVLFLNHPYRLPIIGWQHEMQTYTTQDAIDFYTKHYAPNNAVLVIAGDVTTDEVKALVGFGDGEWRHKDVWKHTKQVVRQAENRVEIRWAALLHDIGKVRTRSVSPDGEVHFFGHAEVGARMFDKLERRTQFFADDESLRSTVRFLILHHLRAAAYDASWTDSAVRRFGKEMGDNLPHLLCLSRADITTKRPEKKRRGLRQLDELYARLAKIQEQDAVVPPLPSGIGDVLMKHFNLPPSRLIGDIKRALEAEIDTGALQSHQSAEFYLDHVATNAARYGLR